MVYPEADELFVRIGMRENGKANSSLDSLVRETPITQARLFLVIGFAILGLLLIEIGVRMGSDA